MSHAFDLVNIWIGTAYLYASLIIVECFKVDLVREIYVLSLLVHLLISVISINKST